MAQPRASHDADVLAVTGLGLATSLGVSVDAACAAARAGIVRTRSLEPFRMREPVTGEMLPVLGHPVSFLTHGFVGMARLARLGALGLGDMLASGVLNPADLAESAVVLALGSAFFVDAAFALEEEPPPSPPPPSEEVLGLRGAIERSLVMRMLQQVSLPGPKEQKLFFEDHAGLAQALSYADALLAQRKVRRCLVGAIDSYCEPMMLDALQNLDLLKGPTVPAGLVPGEAAAFLLVERPSAATAKVRALVSRASISFVPTGRHYDAPDVHGCRALADCVAHAHAGTQANELWTIGTHNGTTWSAEEWGRTLCHLPQTVVQATQWYPALSFGDTGAASGSIAACLAVRAFERGYAPADSALVWLSSPRGSKGAYCVRAA